MARRLVECKQRHFNVLLTSLVLGCVYRALARIFVSAEFDDLSETALLLNPVNYRDTTPYVICVSRFYLLFRGRVLNVQCMT